MGARSTREPRGTTQEECNAIGGRFYRDQFGRGFCNNRSENFSGNLFGVHFDIQPLFIILFVFVVFMYRFIAFYNK